MQSQIKQIKAREILDSRGNPTVEVDVILENNICGRASVPSGASTGSKEALELRDKDSKRYHGMGILKSIEASKEIAKEIIGMDSLDTDAIDKIMINLDATSDKARLGANTILGISLANSKAAANFENVPFYKFLSKNKSFILPVPMMNVINGGAHADNKLDFQEFMIAPISAPNFKEAVRMGSEVFHALKKILEEKKLGINVGDEGGFAPNINSFEETLDIILMAIEKANYKPGKDIYLALDVAASEFYKNDLYDMSKLGKRFYIDEFIELYEKLVANYPIYSIEDPIAENDFKGWSKLTSKIGNRVQLVGDDVFVTNPVLFQEGIDKKIANSILIKPNQIGTLFETKKTINIANENSYKTIMSHRSGETEDTSISHLAVGLNCLQIKTGSLSRSERLAKYNELIRIEEECEGNCEYAGKRVLG